MSITEKIKKFVSKSISSKNVKQLITEFDTIQKRSQFFNLIINNILENPDQILSRYAPAEGIDLYHKMESSDPVIASAMNTRRSAILNRSWTILQNNSDSNVYDYVRDLFNLLENFRQTLEDALGALTTGFVPLELIWTVKNGKWFIKKIIGRNPKNYCFDANGNLRLLTKDNPIQGEPVPPFKFAVSAHKATADNPYGESVLKPLYWPVTFSRAGWKWWATAIEKYGMPIITATFPENSTESDRRKFEEFVRSLQSYSWSTIPEGFDIELHEAKHPAGDDYLPFLQYADTKKFQVILGQNLTAESARFGSKAQAIVHNQVRYDIILADAANIESTINDQIIKPAVQLNFDTHTPLPKFKINIAPPYDLETLARTYDILSKHIDIDERFLREIFQISA